MEHMVQLIVDEAIHSLKQRMHFYEVQEVAPFTLSEHESLMVNVDIIGDEECSMNLVGSPAAFSGLARKIHGIELEAPIVPSFAGEFWNTVLGPVIKNVKNAGASVDIMPSRALTELSTVGHEKSIHRYFVMKENERLIGNFAIYCLYN